MLAAKPYIEVILHPRKKDCEGSVVLISVNVVGSQPEGASISASGPILCEECVGDLHGVGVRVHSNRSTKGMCERDVDGFFNDT